MDRARDGSLEPGRPQAWRPRVASRRARPIRYDGRVVGVLTIDGAGALEEAALTDDIPALVEFADLAGVLIGREVGERREIRHVRERIHAIIAASAFRPVSSRSSTCGRTRSWATRRSPASATMSAPTSGLPRRCRLAPAPTSRSRHSRRPSRPPTVPEGAWLDLKRYRRICSNLMEKQ